MLNGFHLDLWFFFIESSGLSYDRAWRGHRVVFIYGFRNRMWRLQIIPGKGLFPSYPLGERGEELWEKRRRTLVGYVIHSMTEMNLRLQTRNLRYLRAHQLRNTIDTPGVSYG